MFSARTAWSRAPNVVSVRLDELRREGRPPIDLTVSNPTECAFEVPEELWASWRRAPGRTYRPEPRGLSSAREAVVAEWARTGARLSPEHVFLVAGTSEAYAFLFKLLCDPEDNVLVPCPSYPLIELLAGAEAVKSRSYVRTFDGEWHLSAQAVEEAADERTRAVLVVNPDNPTGSFLEASELRALFELCARREWALVSDEVFSPYGYASARERALSVLAGTPPCLTFGLSGLSKVALLPQLKASWIGVAGPKPLVAEAQHRLEFLADTFLSVSTPVQEALPGLLSHAPAMQAQALARVLANRDTLEKLARGPRNWSVLPSEGGWHAVLRIPATPTEDEVCLRLLEAGVFVHPGYFYDFQSGAHLVVSLLVRTEQFREGALRIASVLG